MRAHWQAHYERGNHDMAVSAVERRPRRSLFAAMLVDEEFMNAEEERQRNVTGDHGE